MRLLHDVSVWYYYIKFSGCWYNIFYCILHGHEIVCCSCTNCEDVPTKSVNSDSGNFEIKSARPAVIRARKNKDKMWKIFDTDPTAINLAIAEHADAKLARIIFEDLTATEKKVIKNLRTVPKPFYAHLNRKKLTKASITSIKTKDKILREPRDIAKEFAGFFATTFTQESDGPLPPFSLPKNRTHPSPHALSRRSRKNPTTNRPFQGLRTRQHSPIHSTITIRIPPLCKSHPHPVFSVHNLLSNPRNLEKGCCHPAT